MSLDRIISLIIRTLIRQATYSVGRAIGLAGIVALVGVLLVVAQGVGR